MVDQPKLGRPPDRGVVASKKLDIRVTPAEHAQLHALAKRAKLSLTQWVLTRLLGRQ